MNQETTPPRKKVLFLITKGTWGGAQRYVYDLATHLPRDAFEAHVAYGTAGVLVDRLRDAHVPTHPIPSLGRDIAVISDMRSFVEIWRCIRANRPDVVHLNSSKAAGLGALAARLLRVPRIVFTVHGWPFGEKRSPLARALIWLVSWLTGLLSDSIICVSEYDAILGRRMPFLSAKVIRIYNGIEPMQLGSGDRIRSAFPAGARIVGTVGELTWNKNHAQLIERAHSDASLHVAIVGEGELRDILAHKIREYGLEERVKLFGFIPAEEALPGFDVFSLPSLKEGLPYVIIQAKMAGLPIEANRVGGVGEILDARDMAEFTLNAMLARTIAVYIR